MGCQAKGVVSPISNNVHEMFAPRTEGDSNMRSWLKAEDHALGTEITGIIRLLDESGEKLYIVIGQLTQDGSPKEGEYSFTLSWKNREILTKLGRMNLAYNLAGRRIWLKKVSYTTYGYNGVIHQHEGFLVERVS